MTGSTTACTSSQSSRPDSRVGLWAIPGLRTVIDTGGDLGVIEIGMAGGLDIGSSGWHDGMLRFEIRRQF